MASNFFPIKNSLVRETEQAGYIVSVTTYPGNFAKGSNNSLIMRFSKTDFVTLKVIDSFGRDVLNVFSGYKEAGVHKYKVNINAMSSGVYYFVVK